MHKHDSLVQLESWGLNVSPYLLYRPGLSVRQAEKILGPGMWGVRTERGDETQCPFWHCLHDAPALAEAQRLLSGGYNVLLQKSIVQDSLANGCVAIPSSGEPFVEYRAGEMTQREAQGQSLKRIDWWSKRLSSLEELLLDEVQSPTIAVAPRGAIIEWSLFPTPRGKLNQPVVWWEVRPYT